MISVDELVGLLALERVGPDQYRADSLLMGHDVVFGGQVLAQSIVAALDGQEDKLVKTVHTVFARSASTKEALDIAVDVMHNGRSLASAAVTISQQGRLCTRSLVLLSGDEPDLIRHADPSPAVPLPAEEASGSPAREWAVQVVGDVDINDPDAVGPPELDVWTRFPGAPEGPGINQALLSFATDGFLIGTAMRPHKGVGQAQAHRTISTGVLTHTLTFHEPFSAGEWLLLSHRSPYAGHGRSYGSAGIYRSDGQLVASFVQDNMIRTKAAQSRSAL